MKKPATLTVGILVCYAWGKGPRGRALSAAEDSRWCTLRDAIRASVAATIPLTRDRIRVPIRRLRAIHGASVLATLSARIERADIVIADVSDRDSAQCNPNVLLEVGMALAHGFGERGQLFIFKPRKTKLPSDLQGLMITEYSNNRNAVALIDAAGFKSKINAAVRKIASSRI